MPPYADDSLSEESSLEEVAAPSDPARELQQDTLQAELQAKQAEADGFILTAARLIAPLLHEGSWARGFDWCREQLTAASCGALASEVQLARANQHLGRKEDAAAVTLLKEFERSDSKQRARAAVNLSTLHLLEGQLEAAGGYADYCCEADPGSTAALVSRGNVHMAQGELELALQVGGGWAGGQEGTRAGGAGSRGWQAQVLHMNCPIPQRTAQTLVAALPAAPAPTACRCTRMHCSWTMLACRRCSMRAWPAGPWACRSVPWRSCSSCCTPPRGMPRPCGRQGTCAMSWGTQHEPWSGSLAC